MCPTSVCPTQSMQDTGYPSWKPPSQEAAGGVPSGPPGPYLGREQRQRRSFASSVAEHQEAPQALPLVVTCRRALPSLSVPPAGKRWVSDPLLGAQPAPRRLCPGSTGGLPWPAQWLPGPSSPPALQQGQREPCQPARALAPAPALAFPGPNCWGRFS